MRATAGYPPASFDQQAVRETVLSRAAARFGKQQLRNAESRVNPSLVIDLTNIIRSTASLGHRSSIVLWGPPEGGKRSTLEALSQTFCVSVDRTNVATSSSSSGPTAVVHTNASIIGVSSGTGLNKGVPVLGVVLDGTALRSDNDAAHCVLHALYDFWWLIADIKFRQEKRQQQQLHSASSRHTLNSTIPVWVLQADEILGWLFLDALPEHMHKQPPPSLSSSSSTAVAAAAQQQQLPDEMTSSSSSFGNNNNSSFRSTVQQTFRVFTHGGNTVFTALQTALLELSKAGISPCFFIHDIRSLGQSCDKLVYMISGLLHEQEVFAAAAASETDQQQTAEQSSSSGGGGMSIVMTSQNADLRLEKRLSSRMNCDFIYCPQRSTDFLVALRQSFVTNETERARDSEAIEIMQTDIHPDSQGGLPRRRNRVEQSNIEASVCFHMRKSLLDEVEAMEENFVKILSPPASHQKNTKNSNKKSVVLPVAATKATIHPVLREYKDMSRRCRQLGRSAHVVRRLIECWIELAHDVDFLRTPIKMQELERHAFVDVTPLQPLVACQTDRSRSAPREVVGLLACMLNLDMQQRRNGLHSSSHSARSIQEHYSVFQEMRTSSGSSDAIDSWTKGAAMLRRWGIINTTSAATAASAAASSSSSASFAGGGGGQQSSSSHRTSSSTTSNNIVAPLSSTSKVELEIENIEQLQQKLSEYCSVVYDQATLQAVRALMR